MVVSPAAQHEPRPRRFTHGVIARWGSRADVLAFIGLGDGAHHPRGVFTARRDGVERAPGLETLLTSYNSCGGINPNQAGDEDDGEAPL